jgi:hypothetical protein
MKKFVFSFYLRHQYFLTKYLKWLIRNRNYSVNKIIINLMNKGLTRYFLVARRISLADARKLINGSTQIGITYCVCKDCYKNKKEQKCIFMDFGYEIYKKNGPYKISKISKRSAIEKITSLSRSNHIPIIPWNPLRISIFPEAYCICNCRSDHCMPLRFSDDYGLETLIHSDIRYSRMHLVIFFISLIFSPLILLNMLYYRLCVDS